METGFRTMDYEADAGEINQVEPSVAEDGTVTIHDSGAVIVAEAGCFSIDEHTARCPHISAFAILSLGDLDDTLSSAEGFIAEVYGGAGADTLTDCARCGGSLYGGSGDDRLTGKRGLLFGESGDDILTGRIVEGNRGNDVLNGSGRGDLLDGGVGNDVITAHSGSDRILPGSGDDVVDGGLGDDRLSYSYERAPIVADLRTGVVTGAGTDTFIGVEGVLGSRRGDVLIGDENANVLGGGKGWDIIHGGTGADRLSGGAGNDVLKGENENDFLLGGLGWDRLFAGPGDDFVRSRDGRRDRVRGQRGHDRARVDRGLDSVRGVETLL
jgi:Ca2+-binding RTX toxin-like protein